MEKYKVICKCLMCLGLTGRIGEYQSTHPPEPLKPAYGPWYPNGLHILKFRAKKPPYPTPKGYTQGFEPKELMRV